MDETMAQLAGVLRLGRSVIGGKAAMLAELSTVGFEVPPGFVVTAPALDQPRWEDRLVEMARRTGARRFAVRSSAAAEDLPDASYAGLYETFLNLSVDGLAVAVRHCFAAATGERVTAYHGRRAGGTAAMAVLVQAMVDPVAAGVVFTVHPVTGDRTQAVVTAVAGLGDPLVSGETIGEEWTVTDRGRAGLSRPGPGAKPVLTAAQAVSVTKLARAIADRYGVPQDVEWAIDHDGKLWLLQARPMTAVPEPVEWTPPGSGLWMRNFRLGEWLPEAVTPLFATWLLPALEAGHLDGTQASVGVRVEFRHALVNGWYYNATPIPSPRMLASVLRDGGWRAVRVLYNALVRVGRDPVAADRAVLSTLEREWRDTELPRYRRLVDGAEAEASTADPRRLIEIVDELGHEAGIYLWYLSIVGGSAWKMEARLTSFVRTHLANVLPDRDGGAQILLRGLPGNQPRQVRHAVHSVDWFHPTAGETGHTDTTGAAGRHVELVEHRVTAQHRGDTALAGKPELLQQFRELVAVNQRYALTREEQARDLTLAWPVLRTCVHRLGEHLVENGVVRDGDDVFFFTRQEITSVLNGQNMVLVDAVAQRRATWQRQRRLAAPLTIGKPLKPIGDVIDRAVRTARGRADTAGALVVGHPAAAGRATGPVRIVHSPDDFADFRSGDILVATATAPAWTPLFALAAAVVTDGGTLAAHASLVAREYGIPAVVGTGNATRTLGPGQIVTVDGTAGTVIASQCG
jgi:phosphohistidine swiveling domain-containing protein